jgi:hypothetical protein
MIGALKWNVTMYELLLSLYPEHLRRDYGAEMTLVFAEELDWARRETGLSGVLRMWVGVLAEFIQFAIPAQASNPAVLVPAYTFAVFAVMIGVEMAIALRYAPSFAILLHRLPATVTVPLLSTPFISFAAVRVSRRRIAPLSLL